MSTEELPGTARIEAFSDGVIAIIVTIMVLELKIPENAVHGAFWAEFAGPMAPKLVAYLLSFIIVAIYWVNHHQMFHAVRRATTKILWSNNLLLFSLSLMPLATAFLGEHPLEFRAIAFYGAVGSLCGFSFGILRLAMAADAKDQAQKAIHADAARMSFMFATLMGAGAMLGLVWPLVALASFVIPPLAYFLPRK